MIGGFSQGCCVALATWLTLDKPHGGVIALSGAQALKSRPEIVDKKILD